MILRKISEISLYFFFQSEKNIAELKAAVASPPEGAAKADAGLDSGSGSGSEKIANAEKSDKSRRSADKAGCCG